MSIIIIKIICSIMISIVGLIATKNITNSLICIKSIKTIVLMGCFIVFSAMLYSINYTKISSIIMYAMMIVTYKNVLNISYTKSIISCGIIMFLALLLDSIIGSICLLYLSPNQIRNSWYIGFCSNLFIEIGILILSYNNKSRSLFIKIIDKLEFKKATKIILFFVLLVVIVNIVLYFISIDSNVFEYNLLIMIILFLLVVILLQERNNFETLIEKYENLFEYVKNFEDWIEKEQLIRHEYKNQLAVLRSMTKEKKVKEKIDGIMNESINIDSEMITELKNLPNGGFKGLLYYKILIAKNNNLRVEADVSEGVEQYLSMLDEEKLKTLSKLIGIYFDNAIEAAVDTKKKLVSLEIYHYDNVVSIVISNSFNNKIDITDRYEKGKSTKGFGRGNGLYFSKKLLSKNKWIEEKQNIIKDLYIEKLKISSTN